MTTELPSINSSTSISDNVDLKNYYDKLLFKNNSGKSLTDLPHKSRLAAAAAANSANSYNNDISRVEGTNEDAKERAGPPVENPQRAHREEEQKIDFINGFGNAVTTQGTYRLPFGSFQMTPSNSEPIPPSVSLPISHGQSLLQQQQRQPHEEQQHQQPIFNFNPGVSMGYTQGAGANTVSPFSFSFDQGHNNHPAYYTGLMRNDVSYVDSGTAAMKGLSLEEHILQPQMGTRRSSYISDALIHSQAGAAPGGYIHPMFDTSLNNSAPKGATFSAVQENDSHLGLSPPTTAPTISYGSTIANYSQQRRHTQPINSLTAPSTANAGYNSSGVSRNRYLSYNKQPQPQTQQQGQQQQPQHQGQQQSLQPQPQQKQQQQSQQPQQQSQQQPQQQQQQSQQQGQHEQQQLQQQHANADSSNGQLLLDNGLILINSQKLVSSKDLQLLYADCGSNYFSSELVFEFIDRIKSYLGLTPSIDRHDKKYQALTKFLAFLKSCNLNYNPQSDAFLSDSQISPKNYTAKMASASNGNGNLNNGSGKERRPSSTSSYLHYKPLALVALKNGKLELLSTPQNTNICMQRGDLVIIDGDRGKDLALVVEPVVDLDLALFVNFLKKKIHFDSLITSKSQHHANETFIQALTESTKGQSDELNSKLYDVIELTQLIVPSKQVLRFATTWEVTTNLQNKFQDELKALHIAQLKLKSLNSGFTHHHNSGSANHSISSSNPEGGSNSASRPQLNIKILNAEFQFDRKKLTFYYVCEERNDFRELIKELFKFYKTRIWLCAIPNNLGIDAKYYDSQRKELHMYQEMMQHYAIEDLTDANAQQGGGFIVAPPLNKIELDNFQIGVYKELVNELFE